MRMKRGQCPRGFALSRAGLIRAVGDAEARMREDALRILRALRFAAKLGFVIEGGTLAAMMAAGEELRNVSAERVAEEFVIVERVVPIG